MKRALVLCLLIATPIAGAMLAQTPKPQGKAPAPGTKTAAPPSAPAKAGPATKTAQPPTKTAPPPTKTTPGPATKAAAQTPATKAPPQAGAAPRPSLTVATGDTMAPPPLILREVFEYRRNGRRDPFVSLLATTDLRPTLDELTLMGMIYEPRGGSVAILHDAAAKQYRVRIGSTLGRMRVTAIRPRAVIFTIEELGTNRQDSLVLNDSTKTRRP